MQKGRSRSKKAISPILATLLLIVIAVAAIVVTYAWIMTYLSGAGEQAGVRLFKSNIRFYGGGANIDIDIGNSGTSDTQIVRVYIGTSATSTENQTTTPSLPASLHAEDILTLTASYSWSPGETYYFKIVSSTGQTIEFPEQAPTS